MIEGTRIDLERDCAGAHEPAACVTEWRAGGIAIPVCLDDLDGKSDCLGLDPCE